MPRQAETPREAIPPGGKPKGPVSLVRPLRHAIRLVFGLVLLWGLAVILLGLAYRVAPPISTLMLGRWLTLLDNLEPDEADIFAHGDETAFELAAIRSSLANLRTFPFVGEGQMEGRLALHGLHFDIGSGELLSLDQASGRFEPLIEA